MIKITIELPQALDLEIRVQALRELGSGKSGSGLWELGSGDYLDEVVLCYVLRHILQFITV